MAGFHLPSRGWFCPPDDKTVKTGIKSDETGHKKGKKSAKNE
jgi:hypothetical protein